jgi:hypothetical protein
MQSDFEKKEVIRSIREENEKDFGTNAKHAVDALLSAGLPTPWMYVFELTQNASDAGAKRVFWKTLGESVLFQHDGDERFEKKHIRGISSVGVSTKGASSVGFMGVGFKSVFSRFLRARISGFGWKFGFNVSTRTGELDSKIIEWFDTLLPYWDEDAPLPELGYTTAFLLEKPHDVTRSLQNDLDRIASPEDPTPLAVLALRGLKQIQVNNTTWTLSVKNGFIQISNTDDSTSWLWKYFVQKYRPSKDAMRRFLEVRRQTTAKKDKSGEWSEREVVALVPLSDAAIPNPPEHGRIYATLPTDEWIPFGIHIQADWFLDVDRQNLREVINDPWQEEIVCQFPSLILQYLHWLTGESEDARRNGYKALCDPRSASGLLAGPLQKLSGALEKELSGERVVPIFSSAEREFSSPNRVARLTGKFLDNFGEKPKWQVQILLGHDLIDQHLLGKRGVDFSQWLGWGSELDSNNINWTENLPQWWEVVPADDKYNALFSLWEGIDDASWNDAPVIPTEDDNWVKASQIKWLTEEAPSEKEASGDIVLEMLSEVLPQDNEKVSPNLRAKIHRSSSSGVKWFSQLRQEVKLSDIIRNRCEIDENQKDLPLVELLEWALHRGDKRQDLVPIVITENGVRIPSEALLADPVILEGGESRRALFSDIPALIEDYAIIDAPGLTLFLQRLGTKGDGELLEIKKKFKRNEKDDVASSLAVNVDQVKKSNDDGYEVYDYDFPFELDEIKFSALFEWIRREYAAFKDKGFCYAESHYYGTQKILGNKSARWVNKLKEIPWVFCTDKQFRKPCDVLLEENLDYDEAPIADISERLAYRLQEEGLKFGVGISKSPVLRRLSSRGGTDLPDTELAKLLREAYDELVAENITKEDLNNSLGTVLIQGRFPLSRIVQRTGTGQGNRGNLDRWVISLSELDRELSEMLPVLELDIPATTTGIQALEFLQYIWKAKPSRVDELRRHIAAAYRYILDDLPTNTSLANRWKDIRHSAQLYGNRKWWSVESNLTIDDVQSPLIRRLLSEDRIPVTSAHLGAAEQVRRVAEALGLQLLSDEIHVKCGTRLQSPIYSTQLETVVTTLSKLPDRRSLDSVTFYNDLIIHVGSKQQSINSYILGDTLLVAGKPSEFAVEAAGQIVDFFVLGQRANEATWLTGALFKLEDSSQFKRDFEIFANSLGLDIVSPAPSSRAEIFDDQQESQRQKDDNHTSGPSYTSDVQFGAPTSRTLGPKAIDETTQDNQSRHKPNSNVSHRSTNPNRKKGREEINNDSNNENTKIIKEWSNAGMAADWFRGLVLSRKNVSTEEEGAKNTGLDNNHIQKRDDHKARKLVIEYERRHGRDAQAMNDDQPGYDVLSVDRETRKQRLIEIKGVQGRFDGDSSVILSSRQVNDALNHVILNSEYWLYVVDRTDYNQSMVYPIPWTRFKGHLKYGFYAQAWKADAESPGIICTNEISELTDQPIEVSGTDDFSSN